MARDAVLWLVAVALMYVPLLLPKTHGWLLYAYWVTVAAAYTAYAVARLRRW